MVVYVEYVIIDNMAIDYLLISLSRKTLKLKPNFLLALLSAAVGTAAAFVIPVLSVNKGVLLAAKVAVGMIISAISGKFRNFKEYVFCYCLFIPFFSAERSSLFLSFWGRNTISLRASATADFRWVSACFARSFFITR